MDIQKIKELALANGFKLKEQASGNMDLNAYVYDFANAIEQEAKAQAVPDLRDLQERIGGHQYYHDEHGHMIVDMDDVVKEISGFDRWKAQAVPEGFVLVPKEPTDKTIAHMTNTPIEVNLLCDHADTFLSEGEACIAYQAMIEAQEPAND